MNLTKTHQTSYFWKIELQGFKAKEHLCPYSAKCIVMPYPKYADS
jgi:hypothetical protein